MQGRIGPCSGDRRPEFTRPVWNFKVKPSSHCRFVSWQIRCHLFPLPCGLCWVGWGVPADSKLLLLKAGRRRRRRSVKPDTGSLNKAPQLLCPSTICSYSMTPNLLRFTHQINTSASETSHICDNPAKLRLRACHVSSVQLQHSGWEDGDLTPVTIFTCCRQTAWHCRVVRAVYPDTPPPSSLFGVCFSLSARLPDFVDNLELKQETVDTIHQSLPEFCHQIVPV